MHRLSLFSWLDVRLGLRLLRKHPMLNLAAIFALAVGIPVGLAPSHLARALSAPLPTDHDNRVRAIRLWDPAAQGVATTWDADFAHWSTSLRSFSSIAAFRVSGYNIGAADGPSTPVSGAQVTEAAFAVLEARPQFGRVLTAGDFEPGATDVAVISDAVWSASFGRDPAVLGRSIRVGRVLHTVVGVMPPGFTFPDAESIWVPMRNASVAGTAMPTRVHVIGRLADGATPESAQAELSARGIAARETSDAASIEERARLRAEVVPFGLLYLGLPAGGMAALPEYRLAQLLMLAVLLVASGNVAMLVFARTATRLRELAIRTALGAQRARIVTQLFIETLLLAVLAAGVGVTVVDWGLKHVGIASIAGANALPYWLSLGLTPATVVNALLLAVVSATVAGVLPAVFITGRAIAQNISGTGKMRFGKLTSTLVIADIAVAVAAVGMAFAVGKFTTDRDTMARATGVPAEEILAVEIRSPDAERLAADQRALLVALANEPGIKGVAMSDALPRMEHRRREYEIDGAAASTDGRRTQTRFVRVDAGYFAALQSPVLAGRDFQPLDAEGATRVVIVNTSFVKNVLGGGDAIGRRVRFPSVGGTGEAEWHEIVGVVGNLGANMLNPEYDDAVYVPVAPGVLNPMHVAVHTAMPPEGEVARVRAIALAVNPDLVMSDAVVLADLRQGDWYLNAGLAVGLTVLVGVLVALATSGLYAMLALAVTERTREIGIRVALGASRQAVLAVFLRRSMRQIGIGALIGFPFTLMFVRELILEQPGGGSSVQALAIALGLAVAVVAFVGLGSCLVPARRILAVDASEAMRADSGA
jgi:putative ABC transport system permease protein